MQAIGVAMDQFKAVSGDYPPGDTSPQAEVNLAKALTGRARWEHTQDGRARWNASTPMSAPLPSWGKPFLDVNQFKLERNADGSLVYNARFLDEWGHPILYRYKSVAEVLRQGTVPVPWKGDGFLLISRGKDGLPTNPEANFVWRDANSRGILAADYFDDPGSGRADNIINCVLGSEQ